MVAIVKGRVLGLLGILGKDTEAFVRQIDSGIPSVDILGQVQFVGRIDKDGISIGLLVLVDPRATQSNVGIVSL